MVSCRDKEGRHFGHECLTRDLSYSCRTHCLNFLLTTESNKDFLIVSQEQNTVFLQSFYILFKDIEDGNMEKDSVQGKNIWSKRKNSTCVRKRIFFSLSWHYATSKEKGKEKKETCAFG